MKFMLIILTSLSLYAQDIQEVEKLFLKRNELQSNTLATSAFIQLSKQTNSINEKCEYLFKASYLKFIFSTLVQVSNKEKIKILQTSANLSGKCLSLLNINSYDISSFKTLNLSDELKNLAALNIQSKVTSIGRMVDHLGNGLGNVQKAVDLWKSDINPGMRMLLGLRLGETFYFAPYRVLGITHTVTPLAARVFGMANRKLALSYLKKANNDSLWPGKMISEYIFNSIAYSDILFDQKMKTKACSLLNEIINTSKEDAIKEIPETYPEFLLDQPKAIERANKYNC